MRRGLTHVDERHGLLYRFFGRCVMPGSGSVYDSDADANACLDKLRSFFACSRPLHVVYFLGHGRQTDGAWKLARDTCVEFADIIDAWDLRVTGRAQRQLLIVSDSCYSGKLCVQAARLNRSDIFLQASCDVGEQAVDGKFTPEWVNLQGRKSSAAACRSRIASPRPTFSRHEAPCCCATPAGLESASQILCSTYDPTDPCQSVGSSP